MNSLKFVPTITQLKQQVQDRNKKKYCNSRQQKALSFYQLYKDKIVLIQRWYRARMISIQRKKETILLAKIAKRQALELRKEEITNKLKAVSERRFILMKGKQNLILEELKLKLQQKLKRVLKGTLQRAEKVAVNNGKAKYVLAQINFYKSRNEQLEGEVDALKFEYDCFGKRKAEWQQKLNSIENAIKNQTNKTKMLKIKLAHMQLTQSNGNNNQSIQKQQKQEG